MAHGFERLPGTARVYVNRSNPNFITGLRLSRRQYDAFVANLGAHRKRATVADLRERLLTTRNTLREVRANVALGHGTPAEVRATEVQHAELERALQGRARTDAGGRNYTAFRAAWAREHGIRPGQATHNADFQRDWALWRGRPNPKGDLAIARQNKLNRGVAIERAGGIESYREEYDKKHGQRPLRVRRSGSVGHRIRQRNVG